MWIPLTAALVGVAQAGSEIGTDRTLGLGAEVGNGTYLNLSGKVWLSEPAGISFHAGTLFTYHEVGARFEDNFLDFEFDWADLPVWWFVGADLGLYSALGYSAAQVGATGGVGAALQFTSFPGEAFVTTGVGVFPVNYCSGLNGYSGFYAGCWIQPRGTAGFRYYF
ncbi:MAG: hypothetical protein ABMB14_06330 [Myxococcota bacterium]